MADFLRDRSSANVPRAFGRMVRKLIPHVAREHVLFPALAGPLFAKVLFGNWLSATMCNVDSAATIYGGHVGDQIEQYADGTRAHSRGEWYFPRLPTNRLRQISPEVRRVCEQHGVRYRCDSLAANADGSIPPIVPAEPPKCPLTNRPQRETLRQPAHTPFVMRIVMRSHPSKQARMPIGEHITS